MIVLDGGKLTQELELKDNLKIKLDKMDKEHCKIPLVGVSNFEIVAQLITFPDSDG